MTARPESGVTLVTLRGHTPSIRAVLVAVALICAGPVLQGTVLARAAPGGITIDLGLAAALAFGATYGTVFGVIAALAAGFMMEAATGTGWFAVAYLTAAVLAGVLADRGWGSSLPAGFLCALAAVAVAAGVMLTQVAMMPAGFRIGLYVGYETVLVVIFRFMMARPRASFSDDGAD